jgi:hypothetical protein
VGVIVSNAECAAATARGDLGVFEQRRFDDRKMRERGAILTNTLSWLKLISQARAQIVAGPLNVTYNR